METFDALVSERGDSGKIWASALKQAIKRRKPEFNESYYGFRAFGNLLEEAQARGLLELGRDEKSGTYVYRSPKAGSEAAAEQAAAPLPEVTETPAAAETVGKPARQRRRRKSPESKIEVPLPEAPPQAALPAPSPDINLPEIKAPGANPEISATEVREPAPEESSSPTDKKSQPRSRRPRKPKIPPNAT